MSKTFKVLVKGDVLDETDETFFVVLSSSINATILRGRGVGTILDDDAPPAISMDDVSIGEGDDGQRVAAFRLRLSAPSAKVVRVNYSTGDGTATTGSDYMGVADGIATFNANSTIAYARVLINGDELDEANENFLVTLRNPPDPHHSG